MKLKGKEALDYIQSNPNSGFKVSNYGGVDPNEFDSYINKYKSSQPEFKEVTNKQVAEAVAPKQKTFLEQAGDFVGNIFSPLRYIAEGGNVLSNLAQGGTQLNDDPEVEKARMEFFSMPNEEREGVTFEDWYKQKGGSVYKNEYKPTFISEEEAKNAVERPLQTTVGQTLKAGSFLIPGGQGVTQAIKLGAAAGGMGSFGDALTRTDDVNEIVSDTVGGAVTGGIGGGVTNKLFSKLGNKAGAVDDVINAVDNNIGSNVDDVTRGGLTGKINQVGENLRKSNLGIKAKKTVTGALDQADLADRTLGIIDRFKESANDVGIGNSYNKLTSELAEKAPSIQTPLNTQGFADDFTNRIASEVDINSGSSVIQHNIDNRLGKLSELEKTPTVEKALELKFDLQSEMSPIYKKLEAGNPLTEKEVITKATHDIIDEQLKKQVPEIAEILSDMSTLHQAAPDVISQSARGTKAGSPFLGLAVDIGRPVQSVKEKVGKTLQNLGSKEQNLPSANFQLPRVPEQVSNFFNTPIGNQIADTTERIVRAAPTSNESNPQSPLDLPIRQDLQGTNFDTINQDQSEIEGSQSYPQLPPSMQNLFNRPDNSEEIELLQMYQLAGKDPSEFVDKILELKEKKSEMNGNTSSNKKLTENDKKLATAEASLDQALNLLESGKIKTGKIANVQNQISDFLGQTSPEMTNYRSKVAAARGMIISVLSGANVPPDEYARFAAAIPEDTDEPNIVKQKIISLKEMLQAYKGL